VRREEGRPRWDPRAAGKPATANAQHTPSGYLVWVRFPAEMVKGWRRTGGSP
jgi:hypothetical protein